MKLGLKLTWRVFSGERFWKLWFESHLPNMNNTPQMVPNMCKSLTNHSFWGLFDIRMGLLWFIEAWYSHLLIFLGNNSHYNVNPQVASIRIVLHPIGHWAIVNMMIAHETYGLALFVFFPFANLLPPLPGCPVFRQHLPFLISGWFCQPRPSLLGPFLMTPEGKMGNL